MQCTDLLLSAPFSFVKFEFSSPAQILTQQLLIHGWCQSLTVDIDTRPQHNSIKVTCATLFDRRNDSCTQTVHPGLAFSPCTFDRLCPDRALPGTKHHAGSEGPSSHMFVSLSPYVLLFLFIRCVSVSVCFCSLSHL